MFVDEYESVEWCIMGLVDVLLSYNYDFMSREVWGITEGIFWARTVWREELLSRMKGWVWNMWYCMLVSCVKCRWMWDWYERYCMCGIYVSLWV